jgi:hypothetical protein
MTKNIDHVDDDDVKDQQAYDNANDCQVPMMMLMMATLSMTKL